MDWARSFSVMVAGAAFGLMGLVQGAGAQSAEQLELDQPVKKDVPFVPTPQPVVDEMLRLAELSPSETLYDLGSGDGRIVIAAAKQYGAQGVGVDIDPQRIRESNENAQKAGVSDRVRFIQGNLFEADLSGADAVTLYLLPRVNLLLRSKLLSELKPGTPVVSHAFDMADWQPDQVEIVEGRTVYVWIVPAEVAGQWQCSTGAMDTPCRLDLDQEFQQLSGRATIGGAAFTIADARLRGDQLAIGLAPDAVGQAPTSRIAATVEGAAMRGSLISQDGTEQPFTARREQRSARLAQ